MKTINHDGETWKVVSLGARRDGKVFCHLAHTFLGRHQRNGWYPVQICDWLDESVVEAAPDECNHVAKAPVDNKLVP